MNYQTERTLQPSALQMQRSFVSNEQDNIILVFSSVMKIAERRHFILVACIIQLLIYNKKASLSTRDIGDLGATQATSTTVTLRSEEL